MLDSLGRYIPTPYLTVTLAYILGFAKFVPIILSIVAIELLWYAKSSLSSLAQF